MQDSSLHKKPVRFQSCCAKPPAGERAHAATAPAARDAVELIPIALLEKLRHGGTQFGNAGAAAG
jgi:hypothetical protein